MPSHTYAPLQSVTVTRLASLPSATKQLRNMCLKYAGHQIRLQSTPLVVAAAAAGWCRCCAGCSGGCWGLLGAAQLNKAKGTGKAGRQVSRAGRGKRLRQVEQCVLLAG